MNSSAPSSASDSACFPLLDEILGRSGHLFWIKVRLLIPCRSRSLLQASVCYGTHEMKVAYSSVPALAAQRVQEMRRPCLPSCCPGISYRGNRSRSWSFSSDPSWRWCLLAEQKQRRGRVTAAFVCHSSAQRLPPLPHSFLLLLITRRENNWRLCSDDPK